MTNHNKINYVEFPVSNIEATKTFFAELFDWQFVDYGDEYTAITNAGIDGGFYLADNHTGLSSTSSVLLVIYSQDIKQTLAKVKSLGGKVVKDIFKFPGGCRFHFTDLNHNEYAVWSENS